jgi:hypothetical protein
MNELTTEDKMVSVKLVATPPQDKTYGINPPEYRRAMKTAEQITSGLLEAGLHVTSVTVASCEASFNDLAQIELLMPNEKTVIRFGVKIPFD